MLPLFPPMVAHHRRLQSVANGVAALLLGAVAACGFQPLGLWPLTLLGLAGLVVMIGAASRWWRAVLIGWLWGVGHFTLGNNWIATAFTYQAKMPVGLGGVAVVVLSAYLAVFPALAGLGAWWLRHHRGAMALGFAGCWIITEWLRSWLFTGFAWNPLGVVLLGDFRHQGLAWLAPWLGTYALSGLVVMLSHWAGWWLGRMIQAAGWRGRGQCLAALMAPAVLLLPAWCLPQGTTHGAGRVPYTLIQPDIAQEELDDPRLYEAHYQTEARLSAPGPSPSFRLVLWPESGIQEYLESGYPGWIYNDATYGGDPLLARQRIARAIGTGGLLLAGTVDLVLTPDGPDMARIAGAQNVVIALDDQGRIPATYAKAHLVPYGEYLPMRSLLEPWGLARLVPGEFDFQPGPGPRTLDLGLYGKAGIQICYEIIFSGQVVDRAHRPDYIVNPSNDGWFGSWGPPQHLAQARLRAIEEGLPVLRSTTNGISAVIDADGIVRNFAPRGTAARFDGMVPPAHGPTLFARLGNILPLGLAIALLVIGLLVLRRSCR